MCADKTKIKNKIIKKLIFSNDFYSDLETDGMLFGAIVRSPFSTGVITSITHPGLPKGYFLFTADDIQGSNSIETKGVRAPVFCSGKIHYKGEPLGILVGPDEETVYSLLYEIRIGLDNKTINHALKFLEDNYDRPTLSLYGKTSVPPVPDASFKSEKIKPVSSQKNADENILAKRTICSGAALLEQKDGANPFELLFSEADYVVENTWTSKAQTHSYGETNGALCFIKNGILTLYTPTQWLSLLRKAVSSVTNTDPEKIIVCKTKSSSLNTNTVWRNAILSAQICTAVCATGKPVKLMLSRKEQALFMENSAPVKITHKTAVKEDGEITAMHIRIDVDAGAWNPFSNEILDRLVIASCGLYNPQNLKIEATAHSSNTPPSSVNLSTIDSQAFYAVENQMQKISEITGIAPVDLRLKNIRLLSSKATTFPFIFSPGKVYETLDGVTRSSDFARKYTSYRLDEENKYKQDIASPFAPPLRGIGLACSFEGSGYYGTTIYSGNQSLEVTYNSNSMLEIKTMPPSNSIKRIWSKIAADILNIPVESVVLTSAFEDGEEPQLPESINSNISIMTQLLRKCCETIKQKQSKGILPIVVKKSITPSQKKSWNKDTFCGSPFHSTSFGAAVVELELDPCTYREEIREIWITVDGGKILSTKAAETTIKLSIQQTLSELVENETEKCNSIHVQFVSSETDPKQIGDIVPSILPAAYTSALSQALAATVSSLPIKTDTLYTLSSAAQKKEDEKIINDKKKESAETEKKQVPKETNL